MVLQMKTADLLSSKYVFGGVKVHPLGGLHMYFSSLGKVDCTNAWATSPDLGIHWKWVARARSIRSSRLERTGAKQSGVDQLC